MLGSWPDNTLENRRNRLRSNMIRKPLRKIPDTMSNESQDNEPRNRSMEKKKVH